jgi:hypothetical protein
MGNTARDAGELRWAVENFLSANDCFLKAAQRDRSEMALQQARELYAQAGLEAVRPDLKRIIRQREAGLRKLARTERKILDGFRARGFQPDVPNGAALEYLKQAVRDLPGYAPLHWLIARQAAGLGQSQLAREHAAWAADFDPENPEYATPPATPLTA